METSPVPAGDELDIDQRLEEAIDARRNGAHSKAKLLQARLKAQESVRGDTGSIPDSSATASSPPGNQSLPSSPHPAVQIDPAQDVNGLEPSEEWNDIPDDDDDEEASKFLETEKWYRGLKRPTVHDDLRYRHAERTEIVRKSALESRKARDRLDAQCDDNEIFVSNHEECEAPCERVVQPPPKKRKQPNRISAQDKRESINKGLDAAIQKKNAAAKKGPPRKSSSKSGGGGGGAGASAKLNPQHNQLSLESFFRHDIIANAQLNAMMPAIPVSAHKDKQKALTELLASIPTADQNESRSDKAAILEATRKLASKARGDGKGRWNIKGIKSPLFHHQLLGRDRERSPEKPFGGFLCDTMGYGKTLQVLVNVIDGKPTDDSDPLKTTLIVVPSHLITHWRNQIQRHCQEQAVGRVLVYHSQARFLSLNILQDMQSYSIILTTYEEIRRSYPSFDPPEELTDEQEMQKWYAGVYQEKAGPLHRINFRRIVLDEAHMIKNPQSKVSIAVRALTGHFKWVVTGTPLHNGPEEFYPYFDFLKVPHTGRYETFINNYIDGGEDGQLRLTNILRGTMFRRTHASRLFGRPILQLPGISQRTEAVELCAAERIIYDGIIDLFTKYINGFGMSEDSTNQFQCILTMLLRLRMVSCHVLTVQNILQKVLDNEFMTKLRAGTAGKPDDDPSTQIVRLLSLTRSINGPPDNSPETLGILDLEDLEEDSEAGNPVDTLSLVGSQMPSAKLSRVREIIAGWISETQDVKIVVFSQFIGFLRLVGLMCRREGWGFGCFHGKMSFAAREEALVAFREKPEIKVFVTSLKAGGTGLDMSMANKCIMADLWWNEAIQDQAFCRLFRIGQVRDVEFVKLIAAETIDQYMLTLQTSKSAAIENTMGNDALRERSTVFDLVRMFATVRESESGTFTIVPDSASPTFTVPQGRSISTGNEDGENEEDDHEQTNFPATRHPTPTPEGLSVEEQIFRFLPAAT
ncbi:hypothetical protein ASPZODRAFT_21345 [Penicilliopsis zonata CBS 506.65]|uniref:Helicase ATP-binding domain-containing protein n=1 Tax=Penicilliopsis zonata CBS 506.65 TaxID=1073090 RepID=A0A1L9SUG0_9EURO|nr:hypothetical protein ASPZODRAFT_21345 [Penicilliopsis zonata CBS 506.65]OJJ50829.1 hypothetical protein ASPZODRAFT_21345 [Penicilliopsis zonata CBS 506.65]